jgi:hypothetical protein
MQGTPFILYCPTGGSVVFGLSPEDSNITLANPVSEIYLDPYICGGRISTMAALFQKYRIRSGTIRYKCRQPAALVLQGSTLATNIDCELCFGWHQDFFTPPVSFADAVRFGGQVTHVLKNSSCKIGSSPWLFTTTSSSTPDTQDLRQVCFGGIYAFVDNVPNFTTQPFESGYFVFDLDIEFQGAQDGAQLGADKVLSLYKQQMPKQMAFINRMRSPMEDDRKEILPPVSEPEKKEISAFVSKPAWSLWGADPVASGGGLQPALKDTQPKT